MPRDLFASKLGNLCTDLAASLKYEPFPLLYFLNSPIFTNEALCCCYKFVTIAPIGSSRCKRLFDAAKANANGPPMDLRFVTAPKSKVAGESPSATVMSFLHSLYESCAGTLPDVRDDPSMQKSGFNTWEEEDAYAQVLSQDISSGVRKRKKSLNVNTDRLKQFEVRFLPPGAMKDHYEALKAVTDLETVSFKTFWTVWNEQFPFLRFRPYSNHAQCSVCCRHKLLIRGLSNHVAARRHQISLMSEHLRSQYMDRQCYWALRGQSRLRANTFLVAIIDSMDQLKFQYPRTPVAYAKDMSTMQRPKLHVTCCLAHGHSYCFYLAKHAYPKDSSVMTEIVANLLTRLGASGVRLSLLHFHLQSDNTPREFKNNTLLRFLSACVSHGNLNLSNVAYSFCFFKPRNVISKYLRYPKDSPRPPILHLKKVNSKENSICPTNIH